MSKVGPIALCLAQLFPRHTFSKECRVAPVTDVRTYLSLDFWKIKRCTAVAFLETPLYHDSYSYPDIIIRWSMWIFILFMSG